ncbi:site-specific DNA-methyltransferase [Amphibacillus indicireducens]|uniref:Site-specific DNA-methyltransferase n=1 Tax=Amphibacillus indicireducens TaxID=1076330 RepID=A0ABP7VI55_9BACI
MKTKINEAIKDVLMQFGNKYFIEGIVHKSKVIQDLDEYDVALIEAFIGNETVKTNFTINIAGNIVIQTNKLLELFEADEYWQDSYTKYSKKIGLTAGGKFIDESTDVVLDFPYKDTVLKASMSKEDTDKDDLRPDEPFLNEVIAKEEIDVLLDKKILINAKKYDEEGEHEVASFSEDDNLIIKGNNLLALHTLKEKYAGKVKLIYIDPPYNTGNDSFKYNDKFNRSTWLTFIKNRLEVAKDLLSKDGAIFVQCDDTEQSYLKILMDDIFGENNFKNMITIKAKIAGVSGSHQGRSLQNNCEYILMYSKDEEEFYLKSTPQIEQELMQYIEQLKNDGVSWKYVQVLTHLGERKYLGAIKDGAGNPIKMYEHRESTTMNINELAKKKYNGDLKKAYYDNIDKIFDTTNAQSSIRKRVMDSMETDTDITSIEYVPTSGKNKGKLTSLYYKGPKRRLFTWLSDITYKNLEGEIVRKENAGNLWDDLQYNNINKEGEVSFANGKKPEMLIKRIIELCTEENDLVLDFFMGSATTQAVAHKMNRRYIGIEQMDYINTVSVPRLQKVIEGEQSGISKDVEWQGGGSFVYVELMEKNRGFLKSIQNAETQTELYDVFQFLLEEAEVDFRVDLEAVKDTLNELSFSDQKKLLIKIIDKNQLYYNYSEIDDANVRDLIEDNDYAFNKSFYEKGGE